MHSDNEKNKNVQHKKPTDSQGYSVIPSCTLLKETRLVIANYKLHNGVLKLKFEMTQLHKMSATM